MAATTGKQALMEILVGEGVEYVFGIPGATEILFMDALEKVDQITYILGLNEIVCCGMAEGYARAAGKPGFLNLHTGPGLAAALPMLYNAQAGAVPLVITVGQNDSRLLQYDPHLSGDIVGMGRLYTKWCTEVYHAQDLPAMMQRAFKMAMQPPCGPVLVSIPQNVLDQPLDYDYRPGTVVYPRLRPDPAALSQAVALVARTRRPVILVESGVARCDALAETVVLAELIGARVYQGWMSDVNFPVNHPLYLGDLDPTSPAAEAVLSDADLLIGIGCPMFAQGFFNPRQTLPKPIKIIHFDENPWEIGKNFPVDCGIQGDIKAALEEFNAKLKEALPPACIAESQVRIKEIACLKAARDAHLAERIQTESNQIPIAVVSLMAAIKAVLPSGAIVVDDCWSSSAMLRQVLDLVEPHSFFRSRRGGSIGWGLPGAMGVQLGRPEKKVVSVCGDGSAAWSMQSLWTAARYHIPVTYVITHNATYRQVKLVRKQVLGDYPLDEKHIGMELDEAELNFVQLAGAMGVKGWQVKTPSELRPALEAALALDGPSLIEVFVENPAR